MQLFDRTLLPGDVCNIIGDGKFMLDIGANTGEDAFAYLSNMPSLVLYAFEPEPAAIERFKAGNIFGERCRLFEVAVGARTGRAHFHRSSVGGDPRAWTQSGSLCTPTGHLDKYPWCEFKHGVTVDCIRLDEWSKQFLADDIVPFIKADVQGAEHLLIEGGRETLRRTRFFYTEYDDEQLYEGQIPLLAIESKLPEFQSIAKFQNNVLMKNMHL